jgi:outer membrane protein assembly factor BamB
MGFVTNFFFYHHGGVVLHDGYLYGAHGGLGGGRLVCLDFKTGKSLWDELAVQKGSVAFADGRLYYRTETGTVLLIEPDAKKYSERGRFTQPGRTRSPAWAHPVISNGKLYIRDQDVLYCYDVKARPPSRSVRSSRRRRLTKTGSGSQSRLKK